MEWWQVLLEWFPCGQKKNDECDRKSMKCVTLLIKEIENQSDLCQGNNIWG